MPKLLVLDFDDTLLDTNTFKLALAKAINLTPQQWQIAYDGYMADNTVFEPAGFLQGVTPSEKEAFFETLKKIERYVYKDSLLFVNTAIKQGWDVRILSAGSHEWQTQKIQSVRWPESVQIHIVEDDKSQLLSEWSRQVEYERIVFVDDKVQHLEAVATNVPEVECYQMLRDSSSASTYGKIITKLQPDLLT